jgi:hypothetical protein
MKPAILAGTLAALTVGVAFATEPMTTATSGDPSVTFKSLDTNGDGLISESEAAANPDLSAGYRSAVSDATKGMTQEEFDAWNASHQQGQTPPSQPPSQ